MSKHKRLVSKLQQLAEAYERESYGLVLTAMDRLFRKRKLSAVNFNVFSTRYFRDKGGREVEVPCAEGKVLEDIFLDTVDDRGILAFWTPEEGFRFGPNETWKP
jgi:hypothetical protein